MEEGQVFPVSHFFELEKKPQERKQLLQVKLPEGRETHEHIQKHQATQEVHMRDADTLTETRPQTHTRAQTILLSCTYVYL